MTPQFVLAKYVPDLGRMEPRNIGVFVWWKGEIRCKFLSTEEADFINEPKTYERWTTFWVNRIAGDSVRPSRGKPISKSDPQCLNALVSTQKGNYILVESGELLRTVKKSEIAAVTDYLFQDLVSPVRAPAEDAHESFVEHCNAVLERSKVAFARRQPITCRIRGVERHLHPDYYIGNGHGKPKAIFQRAKMCQEQSVNNATLVVDTLLNQGIVTKSSCRVLVRSEDINGTIAEEGMRLFEELCGTIDVSATDAEEQLLVIARGNGRG